MDRVNRKTFAQKLMSQWQLLILSVPFMLLVFLFAYVPLWGWSYAFFEVNRETMLPNFGAFQGFSNFTRAFEHPRFMSTLRNSLVISISRIITGYLGTITLALMINELRVMWFKRTVQTISYLPHFISWVVAATMISVALSPDGGVVNNVLIALRVIDSPVNWLMQDNWRIWMVLVLAALWKEIGWGTIIYLAAMSGIDPELYEAAQIDGASRMRRITAITLPSIMPVIRLLLILSIGNLLSVGFEMYLLFQRPFTLEYSEVIETLVFRTVWSGTPGRMHRDIPVATAIGIMNSFIAFILVLTANRVSSKLSGERLF